MGNAQRKSATAGTSGAQQNTLQHLNNTANRDPLSAFINAMQDAGIAPTDPSEIIGDGTLHRLHLEGDKRCDRSGWCVLHMDGRPAGAFGSWKAGVSGTWRADRHMPFSTADREAIAQARREREAQRERDQLVAAHRALQTWNETTPRNPAHGYQAKKRVQLANARQHGEMIVLRIFSFEEKLVNLQMIAPDGRKRFLKNGRKAGCFAPIAGCRTADRILICEGAATGASLAEAEPDSFVIAALDAYNMKPVAAGARRKWPNAEIVVCGDTDPVGEERARIAAKAAGAMVAFPDFPDGVEGSDFNDLANAVGVHA